MCVAGPHESTDETVVAVAVAVVLEVKAVVVEDDDAWSDLGLPLPPRARDAREKSELSSLGLRQLQPMSTTTGGCRGSTKLPPLRRPQILPDNNDMAGGLLTKTEFLEKWTGEVVYISKAGS